MSRHFCAKSVFTDAPNELTGNDIHVYTYLVACSNAKDGMAWPSLESIATDTRLSRATVSRAITNLTGSGLVVIKKRTTRKTKRGRGVNMYFLPKVLVDQVGPEPEPELPPISSELPHISSEVPPISDEVAPKPEPKPKPKKAPKPKPTPTTEIPAELLAVDGFADAWADWVAYRQQAKLRPLTAIGTTRQFSAMVKAVSEGVDVVACIDKAITSNWQGVHLDAVKPQSQGITKAAPKKELNILDKMRLQIGVEFDEILKEDAAKTTTSTLEALPF